MNPGYDMYDFCKICDPVQFMAMYLQILFSLHTAYTDFGFTHYDLHAGNIMIQKTYQNETVYIPYMYKNTTYYVMARGIAKIIDYGRSHVDINYEGHTMGFGNFMQGYPLESNPMHDVFKITGYLLWKLLAENNIDTYKALYGLMQTFPPFDQARNAKEMKKLIYEEKENNYFEYRIDNNCPAYLVNNQREFFEGHIDRVLRAPIEHLDEILFSGRPDPIPNSRILECAGDCYNRERIEEFIRH